MLSVEPTASGICSGTERIEQEIGRLVVGVPQP